MDSSTTLGMTSIGAELFPLVPLNTAANRARIVVKVKAMFVHSR